MFYAMDTVKLYVLCKFHDDTDDGFITFEEEVPVDRVGQYREGTFIISRFNTPGEILGVGCKSLTARHFQLLVYCTTL